MADILLLWQVLFWKRASNSQFLLPYMTYFKKNDSPLLKTIFKIFDANLKKIETPQIKENTSNI
jgi:hypothetical protein